MTKVLTLAPVALALMTTTALAGGLDRSGQDIGALFQDGSYASLGFPMGMPNVQGTFAGVAPSEEVAPDYTILGGAIKSDFGPNLSGALIFDQPWGAAVEYNGASYPLVGTSAHVSSSGLTALARYKLGGGFSVHGGLRYITASGDLTLSTVPYSSTYSSASDLAYVVGAAWEKPDIALRVALTYSSATSYALDGTAGDAVAEMPQSVNLDFQTGIAANTLLFGQIRWADWTAASITDSLVGTVVDYSTDTMTYSLGIGRKFNDHWSGAVLVGYEPGNGEPASNLSPTDGYMSLGLGGTYTNGNMKISAGVNQYWLGDATTETIGGDFSGNTALGVGVKVEFTF